MSKSVFKKWTSAVLYLNEKIKNNHLIAGRNIQLENTGKGIRIHGSAENSPSSDNYNGAFKVVRDGDNLKVVYGLNPSHAYCGGIDVPNPDGSGNYYNIPVVSFPITGDLHYLTLLLVYNLESEKYEAEITSKTDGWEYLPSGDNPGLSFQIALYTADNGIEQKLIIYGGNNSQFRLELQGKYWV